VGKGARAPCPPFVFFAFVFRLQKATARGIYTPRALALPTLRTTIVNNRRFKTGRGIRSGGNFTWLLQ
jgi:hypothetical protein